jgi:hypothetical protein
MRKQNEGTYIPEGSVQDDLKIHRDLRDLGDPKICERRGNFRPTREDKRQRRERDGERFPRAESYTRGSTIWQTPTFGKYI